MAQRDQEFGQRVRTARGYAGISQVELARRITEKFPEHPVSAATIKRLERNDLSVKGDQDLWAHFICETTGAPPWFLRFGWGAFERIYGRALSAADQYDMDDDMGELGFEVLDVDFGNLNQAAESAAQLRIAATSVEGLVNALVAQGHGELEPGGSAIRSAVAHAFNHLPVTQNQVRWVVTHVRRRLQGIIDGELRRAGVSVTNERDHLIDVLVDQVRNNPELGDQLRALTDKYAHILEAANPDIRRALMRATVEQLQTGEYVALDPPPVRNYRNL